MLQMRSVTPTGSSTRKQTHLTVNEGIAVQPIFMSVSLQPGITVKPRETEGGQLQIIEQMNCNLTLQLGGESKKLKKNP